MPASRHPRTSRTILATAVTAGLLSTMAPAAVAETVDRVAANPTGTASGSRPNGEGPLKLSLTPAAGGKVKVSWVPWAPSRIVKKFVVRVGLNRLMDSQVRRYTVKAKKRGVVVPQAFGVTPSSGNFTFVKLTMTLKDGRTFESPTKWIQAPIGARCTASPANQVKVATYNVRSWSLDLKPSSAKFSWAIRG